MTKEAWIFNGEKMASSVNGVGKTGQLLVKETNGLCFCTIYKKTQNWLKAQTGHLKS